ncbi:Acyl carrier protein [Candidatus Magnetobacterium bavaricum]|uniref:Acyl carrier protein n=1 Tax=Candidatus Magnetobacterium bavaricum TaxID=29290 RepID=A0A0F3GS07_9BACT|nr:Acyl carrier protein [Candidatus Magnetobacterium bavaricum]
MTQGFIDDNRVMDEVKKAIAQTLSIDTEKITPESSLVRDLGAESLDFLDINYRLEQVFGIKMARHFILEHMEEMFGEGSAIDENGQLTEKAVNLMRIRLGDETEGLQAGMDMDQVPPLITVATIARGVKEILSTLPEKCTSCGATQYKCSDGALVECSGCGQGATYSTGDDLIKEWLTKIQQEHKIF